MNEVKIVAASGHLQAKNCTKIRPGPRWGSLQRSPRPPSWWGGGSPKPHRRLGPSGLDRRRLINWANKDACLLACFSFLPPPMRTEHAGSNVRGLKMQDRKMRDQKTGPENGGLAAES